MSDDDTENTAVEYCLIEGAGKKERESVDSNSFVLGLEEGERVLGCYPWFTE